MATSVSLQTIVQAIIRRLWAGHQPIVATADSSGNTTTALAIADFAYTSAHANSYDGVNIWVVGGSGRQESRVIRAGFAPSTGIWTLSPALGVAPTSATVWFLYGMRRDDILQAVNRVLDRLYLPTYLPLTLVTDGDMESSATSDWTSIGSPTLSKVTTAARVLTGQRALRIQTTAVNDGVSAANIRVQERETLLLSVAAMCDTGSVEVELRDVTNGATIDSVVTLDQEAYTEARFWGTVPTGCEEVTVRIRAQTATSDIYIGWVSLIASTRQVYNLPSTLEDVSFLESPGLYRLPLGYAGEVNRSYIPLSRPLTPALVSGTLRDYLGANSQRITLPQPSTDPLFLHFRRSFASLTLDTDTTAAPEELVVAGTLADLYGKLEHRAEDESSKQDLRIRKLESLREYHHLLQIYQVARPMIESHAQHRVGAE